MHIAQTKVKIDKDGNIWVLIPKVIKGKPILNLSTETEGFKNAIQDGIKNGEIKGKLSAADVAKLIKCDSNSRSNQNRIGLALNALGFPRGRGSKGRYYIIQ